MKVVIAPQAFKGSLDAVGVASAIARGVPSGWETVLLPMADGGEGTVDALLAAIGGEPRSTIVEDPLGRPVRARWALLADGRAAIEMAAASGLTLLASEELDPTRASTYGTGQLIREALGSAASEIIVGLGGSATNDGGAGALQALGARLLDSAGRELDRGALALQRLTGVDLHGLALGDNGRTTQHESEGSKDSSLDAQNDISVEPDAPRRRLRVICDVTNPLLGPDGATAVYGPQKGVTPELRPRLEAALGRWADAMEVAVGRRLRNEPGAGAAGGLGFALLAIGATLEQGAQMVLDLAHFDHKVRGADIVITGEGRLDGQSLHGKASVAVARRAKAAGVPVVAIVGSTGEGFEAAHEEGITHVVRIEPGPMETTAERVAAATERALATMDLAGHASRPRRQ